MSEVAACPLCGALPCDWANDPYAASVTGTGTAETLQAAQGEACQNGQLAGDAKKPPQVSDNEL